MSPHEFRRTRCSVFMLAALSLPIPGVARANGAFPDSGQVLLPRRAAAIFASTNFGLLTSRDEGKTWRWICEQAIGPLANLYQVGPPPNSELFAQSDAGLHISRDDGCTWQVAAGSLSNTFVVSAYPDPTNADRVLAVAQPSAAAVTSRMALYESMDGGTTFGPALFVVPNSELLSGVESATTDPKTIYLTMYGYEPSGIAPAVVHSSDSGVTWTIRDARAFLGNRTLRLIRVDPRDEKTVYFRVSDSKNDALAVTNDAGETFRVALTLEGMMSAFLLRPNGDIFVAGTNAGTQISHDGGLTFSNLANAPRFRGIAERDAVLYATADNFIDGFAVASSSDDGNTWTPLLRFGDICEPLDCEPIHNVCALPWVDLTSQFGIKPDQCLATQSSASAAPTNAGGGCSLGRPAGDGSGLVFIGTLCALTFPLRRRVARSRFA